MRDIKCRINGMFNYDLIKDLNSTSFLYSHSKLYLVFAFHIHKHYFSYESEYCQQEFMAPRRGEKKQVQDQSVVETNPNSDMFSDTTACLIESIKSWAQVYKILKKRNPKFFMMKVRMNMF